MDAVYGPPRLGDVKDSLADINKAKNLMDYNPKFSVKNGLRETWRRF